MKKIILGIVIVAVCIMGVLFFSGRLHMGMFSRSSQGGDLIIVNDSDADISTAVRDDGKEIDTELKAGEQATGGQGFIRVYTAKRSGSYELAYPFPRPAGSTHKVTLSQIIAAPQKETTDGEVYAKRGMIGDINVEYEEMLELSSTY
jgi:hypothetical protein